MIIATGINDSRGINFPDNLETKPKNYKKNIEKLVAIAKQYTKHIVLLELTPVDEKITNPFENTYFLNSRIQEFNLILKEVASKKEILLLEIFNQFSSMNYKQLLSDGVHPNKDGYEVIYQIIKKYLIDNKYKHLERLDSVNILFANEEIKNIIKKKDEEYFDNNLHYLKIKNFKKSLRFY